MLNDVIDHLANTKHVCPVDELIGDLIDAEYMALGIRSKRRGFKLNFSGHIVERRADPLEYSGDRWSSMVNDYDRLQSTDHRVKSAINLCITPLTTGYEHNSPIHTDCSLALAQLWVLLDTVIGRSLLAFQNFS